MVTRSSTASPTRPGTISTTRIRVRGGLRRRWFRRGSTSAGVEERLRVKGWGWQNADLQRLTRLNQWEGRGDRVEGQSVGDQPVGGEAAALDQRLGGLEIRH